MFELLSVFELDPELPEDWLLELVSELDSLELLLLLPDVLLLPDELPLLELLLSLPLLPVLSEFWRLFL